MTNPKTDIEFYLQKLIEHFVFIKRIYDELETITNWIGRPGGVDALEEGASFFNLFQRLSNQTLLIELCKFIAEKKSLTDFLNKCKDNSKPLEPTSLITDGFPRRILTPEEFGKIIDEMIANLESHLKVIQNLKARRDKALAHTDSSFFNNPTKHFETYPLMFEDISGLLKTIEEILKQLALHILQTDYDFTVHTVSGLDRVLEFMRAYHKIIRDHPVQLKYRFDDQYLKNK